MKKRCDPGTIISVQAPINTPKFVLIGVNVDETFNNVLL